MSLSSKLLIGAGLGVALLASPHAAFFAVPQSAVAQTQKCQREFNMADVDNNGRLSAAELAKIDATYDELNSNNDGRITREDFRGCIEGVFQRLRKRAP